VADIIMCLTGLMAAFSTKPKTSWGYYAIACVAYLTIVYQLAVQGRATIRNKDKKTATFFSAVAGYTLVLWAAYPM
jgi:bacteriorhodopsin